MESHNQKNYGVFVDLDHKSDSFPDGISRHEDDNNKNYQHDICAGLFGNISSFDSYLEKIYAHILFCAHRLLQGPSNSGLCLSIQQFYFSV